MSVWVPTYGFPAKISGAAYAYEPQLVVILDWLVWPAMEKPKSDTFTLHAESNRMFSHFKSLHGQASHFDATNIINKPSALTSTLTLTTPMWLRVRSRMNLNEPVNDALVVTV